MHEFSAYLSLRNKIGSIIYDHDGWKRMDTMQEFFWQCKADGSGAYGVDGADRFEKVLNSIISCHSHYSSGLQLADFVAHSVWRKHEKGDDQYYIKLSPYLKVDLLV